jgi:hypothetical protein
MVRYRAKPSVCNACPAKAHCTSSPHGREIVRALDPWPHSEAGRFHRGLALMLISLAALILVIEVTRHHTPIALAVLAAPVTLAGALGWRFLDHLRHTPAGFPDPTPSTGLRLTTADRTAAPPAYSASVSRSRWGSPTRWSNARPGRR